MSTSSTRPPVFLERHRLTWGADEETGVFERIHDTHFRTTLAAVECSPDGTAVVARWTDRAATPYLDGVAAVDARRADGEHGFFTLDLLLAEPLPRILLPWSGAPAPPGEISFDEALARAAVIGHPIAPESIREARSFFVFPTYQIGCYGVLVERRGGRAVEFGSTFSIDDWVWGHENGLLDDPPGDLVIVEVRDSARALEVLGRVLGRPSNRPLRAGFLASLPITLPRQASWMAIPDLRGAGDSMRWEIHRRDPDSSS